MSFQEQSLLGVSVGTNPKLLTEVILEDKKDDNLNLLLTVVVSAIIFVTVIALYEVIKVAISNYYDNIASMDPNSNYTQEEIERNVTSNYYELLSTVVFAIICLVIALIFIPILFVIKTYYT